MIASWPTVVLGSLLTDIQTGFASGRHNTDGVGVPHFRPMNVSTDGLIERTVMKYVDPLAGRADIRLRRGDVLFNNTNSPELVGKTAIFAGDDAPAFSNHMTRLRVDSDRLDSEYLALRLHQAWREGWFAAHCNNHVSQASIGREVLGQFEIELPPLDVQRAVAALAGSIDRRNLSASAHIGAARRALDRFRQAILAAACSGQLTSDWRATNPDATLIELELAQAGVKRRSTARPAEVVDLEVPELPSTYTLTTVAQAAELIQYGTSQKSETEPIGVPVLRMGNIQDCKLDLADLKFAPLDDEIRRLILADGDLLFNRTNSPELVGKAAVFHEPGEMTFASYLIRVRFPKEVAEADFVNYWINSAWGRAWARHVKTDGVSQSNINGTKLGEMPLPLPPITEQREIVRRASAMLAVADALTLRLEAAARRVDRTSQAVLAKAFRGELIS